MKEVNYKEKGITLVALVVTIIILLILATIVIAGIINGKMIERSKEAAELHKIEQYREAIELVRPELDIERSEGKALQTSEEYLTKFKDKIKEQELFKDARRVDLVQNGTTKEDEIIVETKEGYVYRVTEDGTEYLGKTGENLPPSLADGDIGANINPDGWTNQDVKVTLYITEKGKSKLEGYKLQYLDGSDWKYYNDEEITFSKNGHISVRAINNLGNVGGELYIDITTIDKLYPKDFTPTATATTNKVTVTAEVEDREANEEYGKSEIGQYRFDIGSGWTEWQDENVYTFDKLERNSDYTINVEAKDNAGNVTPGETINIKTLEKLNPEEMKIDDYIAKYVNYKQVFNDEIWLSKSQNGVAEGSQEIVTDKDLNWRIWSIGDGKLTLISETPAKAGCRTGDGVLPLEGYEAYNDLVYMLNYACKGAYANSGYTGLTARSINLEDIRKVTTYDWTTDVPEDSKLLAYGETRNNMQYKYAPKIYGTLETTKDNAIKYQSYQNTSFGTDTQYDGYTTGSLFTNTGIWHTYGLNTSEWIHPKYVDLVISSNVSTNNYLKYYLATRRTYIVESSYVDFGGLEIRNGEIGGYELCESRDPSASNGYSSYIRPMIEIPLSSLDLWESNEDGMDFEIAPRK